MPPAPDEMTKYRLEQRARSGANWFYWIAGLSLINSVSQLAGSQWGFIAGLGFTQFIDALTIDAEHIVKVVGFGLNLSIAGCFIALGYFARHHRAAFIVGMVIYAIDGSLFLLVQEWIGLGFHAFVLSSIFSGYKAFMELKELTPSMDTHPV
jgi:hypothetical protein